MNQISDPNALLATASLKPDFCVEFFGLPGSGKTTIAREVFAMLARRYPELIYAPRLLRDEAGTVVRTAAKLRLIVHEIARGGTWTEAIGRTIAIRQPHRRDSLRAAFTVATVGSLYANFQRRHLGAVLDQGLLQALWSVQLRARDDETCGALAIGMLKDAACSGRFHIAVETPREVCVARLQARLSKHSRMQDPGADQRLWDKAELLRQTILSDLRAANLRQGIPDRIFTIDGTADPRATAGLIAATLLQPEPAQGHSGSAPAQGVTT